MSAEAEVVGPRRYGHLRRPRGAGLFGFSGASTYIGLGGLLLTMLAMMAAQMAGVPGLPVAAAFALVTVVAVVPTRRSRRTGLTGYDRMIAWVLNRTQTDVAAGYQGPVGFVPDGKCRLPGFAAGSKLFTGRNAYGEHFGVVVQPIGKKQHYSVVLEGAATGTELVDAETIDQQVAHWGGMLAMLGQHRDVVGASVIVETAPDPGVRLRAEVEGSRAENGPQWAQQVMDEIVSSYPSSQSIITTRVAITLTDEDRSMGRVQHRSQAEMHTRLANLLPALVASARAGGAGPSCRAMAAQDIIDAVRVAFDPAVAEDVEAARREPEGTGLTWETAGPVRWVPADNHVHHDRAWSVTYQMIEPPTTFFAATLEPLLRPNSEIMRKRVALMYRPLGPFEAPKAVDRDVNAAKSEASKKNASARAEREYQIAQQVSREEAQGAGLSVFGIAVTATTDDRSQLERVESAVAQLAAPARLRMRPALGNQAAAFLSTLPIGVVLPAQMALPVEIHDQF